MKSVSHSHATNSVSNLVLASVFVHSPAVVEILWNTYKKLCESLERNGETKLSLLILNPCFRLRNNAKLTILSRLSRHALVLKNGNQYLISTCTSCNKVYGLDVGILIKNPSEEESRYIVNMWKNIIERISVDLKQYIILEPRCSLDLVYSAKAINQIRRIRRFQSTELSLQRIISSLSRKLGDQNITYKLYKIYRIIIPFATINSSSNTLEIIYDISADLINNKIFIKKTSRINDVFDNHLKKILETFKDKAESSGSKRDRIKVIQIGPNGECSITSLLDIYNDYLEGVRNYCKHIEENYLDPQSITTRIETSR